AVMLRELEVFRTERKLAETLKSAQEARSQLGTVLHRSNDAIIQVQEGIVVDANPAWLELYGVAEGVSGEPVMDLFDDWTHAAPGDARARRHALPGAHLDRQVHGSRARGRRHGERGDPDRVRAAAEGDPASEGARRTLRRSALPRAPRARQRAGHQRLERAAALARSEAGDAHP